MSSGVFPQDEYPEEVSTDEDDDMFGSRKRMKRKRRNKEDDEAGSPTTKKVKGVCNPAGLLLRRLSQQVH